MVDYSKMTTEQIAAHVEADAHNWEWSVDEDMLAELLGKR